MAPLSREPGGFGDDERAVSEMVATVLTLTLAVVAGVGVVGVGTVVVQMDGQQQMAPKMAEHSQQVSGGIERVDRLVRQSETSERIGQRVALPERLEGQTYVIQVLNSSDAADTEACGPRGDAPDTGCLLFSVPGAGSNSPFPVVGYFATSPSVSVRSTTVQGGPLDIVREQGSGTTITVTEGSS